MLFIVSCQGLRYQFAMQYRQGDDKRGMNGTFIHFLTKQIVYNVDCNQYELAYYVVVWPINFDLVWCGFSFCFHCISFIGFISDDNHLLVELTDILSHLSYLKLKLHLQSLSYLNIHPLHSSRFKHCVLNSLNWFCALVGAHNNIFW